MASPRISFRLFVHWHQLKRIENSSKGLSGKKATEPYGIHNLPTLQEEVEAALSQAEDIPSAVNELAQAKEKATLEALGIYIDKEDSNDSENENEDSEQSYYREYN